MADLKQVAARRAQRLASGVPDPVASNDPPPLSGEEERKLRIRIAELEGNVLVARESERQEQEANAPLRQRIEELTRMVNKSLVHDAPHPDDLERVQAIKDRAEAEIREILDKRNAEILAENAAVKD